MSSRNYFACLPVAHLVCELTHIHTCINSHPHPPLLLLLLLLLNFFTSVLQALTGGQDSPELIITLRKASSQLLSNLRQQPLAEDEDFVVLMALLENPLLLAPEHSQPLLEMLVSYMVGMTGSLRRNLLHKTLVAMPETYFLRVLQVFALWKKLHI